MPKETGEAMPLKIFGLGESKAAADSCAKALGVKLSPTHEEIFPDGELAMAPKETVEGFTVVVFHSLAGTASQSAHDKFFELAVFLEALRERGARGFILAIPYLCYSRADSLKKPFDSLALKVCARFLNTFWPKAVLALEAHNLQALENAFDSRVVHVSAQELFLPVFAKEKGPLVVMSPDLGGIKRAQSMSLLIREHLSIRAELAFVEKYRKGGELGGSGVYGDLKGKTAVIYDDMISTGQTLLRALEQCQEQGAAKIYVLAAHGIFSANRERVLAHELINQIYVSDSNPALRSKEFQTRKKLKVLGVGALFAKKIKALLPNLD